MSERPTVLIVEDNVEVAEMTCVIVELAGLQAIYRTNVAEAMDYIARYPDSTVGLLADINLETPMSGIELAVYVAEEWPLIAICVTSGYVAERPKRLPAKVGFLPKPWNMPDLLAFINAAAGR
jgi:two-component system cell cycle response regulator CpdR